MYPVPLYKYGTNDYKYGNMLENMEIRVANPVSMSLLCQKIDEVKLNKSNAI